MDDLEPIKEAVSFLKDIIQVLADVLVIISFFKKR